MRSENQRSTSDGITSSFYATKNQETNDFQAGTPITCLGGGAARGCWRANTTLAFAGSIEHVAHPRDIVGQRDFWELRSGHLVAAALQMLK